MLFSGKCRGLQIGQSATFPVCEIQSRGRDQHKACLSPLLRTEVMYESYGGSLHGVNVSPYDLGQNTLTLFVKSVWEVVCGIAYWNVNTSKEIGDFLNQGGSLA